MSARRESSRGRRADRAAPPDAGGSRGDFSVPGDTMRAPQPGEEGDQPPERRPALGRLDRTLALVSAAVLALALVLGVIALLL